MKDKEIELVIQALREYEDNHSLSITPEKIKLIDHLIDRIIMGNDYER